MNRQAQRGFEKKYLEQQGGAHCPNDSGNVAETQSNVQDYQKEQQGNDGTVTIACENWNQTSC